MSSADCTCGNCVDCGVDNCELSIQRDDPITPVACRQCRATRKAGTCDCLIRYQTSRHITCTQCGNQEGGRTKCSFEDGRGRKGMRRDCHCCVKKGLGASCDLFEKCLDSIDPPAPRQINPPFEPPATRIEDLIKVRFETPKDLPPPPTNTGLSTKSHFNCLFDISPTHSLANGGDLGTQNSADKYGFLSNSEASTPTAVTNVTDVQVEGSYNISTDVKIVNDYLDGITARVENEDRDAIDDAYGVFTVLKLHLIRREDLIHTGYADYIAYVQGRNERLLRRLKLRKLLPNHINTMEDVLVESYRHLYNSLRAQLKEDATSSDSDSMMTDEAVDWLLKYNTHHIFGAPAMWTDSMLERLKKLLSKAGFVSPQLLSESDMNLATHIFDTENNIVAGDRKVPVGVCLACYDIGHGSADLSHTIVDKVSPEIQLRSVAPTMGLLAGGSLINYYLTMLVRKLLGEEHLRLCAKAYREGHGKEDEGEEAMIDDFLNKCTKEFEGSRGREGGKRNFGDKIWDDPRRNLMLNVGINMPPKEGVCFGSLIVIPGDELRKIFDQWTDDHFDALDKGLALIRDELDEPLQLLVCGGSSQNPYLRKRLRQKFRARAEPINVTFPLKSRDNPSQVAAGAMVAFTRKDIGERLYAQEAYGVGLRMDFNHVYHNPRDIMRQSMRAGRIRQVDYCFVPITLKDELATSLKFEAVIEIAQAEYKKRNLIELRVDILKCINPELADKRCWKAGHSLQALFTDKVRYEYEIAFNISKDQLHELKPVNKIYNIAYRIVPMWEGLTMVFFVVVHPSGKFPFGYDDHHYIKDCLVKRLELSDMKVREKNPGN